MKDYLKNPLVIVIVLAIIILGVYYFGKSEGEDEVKIVPAPLPKETDWGAALTDEQSTRIRSTSLALYTDMSGPNWGHDLPMFSAYQGLPDVEFVGVYNDFNDLYVSEGSGTLKAWLLADYFTFSGDTIRDSIITRMNTFNLV